MNSALLTGLLKHFAHSLVGRPNDKEMETNLNNVERGYKDRDVQICRYAQSARDIRKQLTWGLNVIVDRWASNPTASPSSHLQPPSNTLTHKQYKQKHPRYAFFAFSYERLRLSICWPCSNCHV